MNKYVKKTNVQVAQKPMTVITVNYKHTKCVTNFKERVYLSY